jgi:DNA-binding response OmpR family regulator
MATTKILLVEDDKAMAKLLKRYLDVRGFDVVHCSNGNEGFDEFESKRDFDLIILDIMIPYKDGYTLAQEIRKVDEYVPLLFLSSKSLSEDRIKAFKLGADDYITKPFNVEELMLRVNAILKRQMSVPKTDNTELALPDKIQIGIYTLNAPFQKLILGEEERKLTARESDLLKFLFVHKNKLVKREFILQEIWGDDDYYKGRSLDVFMSRLRKYLKDDPNIQIINVHAVGFKFIIGAEEVQAEV